MDVFQKTPTVEIKAGDKAFKSTSCGTWEHVEVSASSGGDDEAASSKTLTDATAMFLVSLVAAVNDSVDQELADQIFAKGLYSVKQLVAQPKYKHISPEVIDMLYDAMLGR